ncbi:MAG: 7TM diverse intracellular signaling domain-containing protein, partial [Bacteroidota bacterium]
FSHKTLPERNFSFPISSVEYSNDTIVIAAEKRNVTFHIEMEFADQIIHAQSLQLSIVWWGILAGFVLMLLLINFYLLFSLKEMLYLWYSLYLCFILCYLGSDTGLFFEFIYPDLPQMNDLIRPFFLSVSLLPMMLFYNSMLELKIFSPRLYRVNHFVIMSYFIILVTAYTTCLSGNLNVYTFWLKVQSVYVPLIFFLLLVESVYCVWQKIQFSVFALISFTVIALCIAILSLVQNGLIPLNGFTAYAHYFAFITDAVVVASSLVYRYYIMAEKAREIREKYTDQQEKIFQETSAWYQEEMGRMSSLLHDSIGGDIGILRIKAETMELTEEGRNKLTGFIHKIGDEVRYMSHHLSPLLLKEKGLYEALDEFIGSIRNELNMSIQFDWVGERANPEFKYQIIIYRIVQELLQNIKKHAGATEVMVQITNESSHVGIYVEDNGKGGGERHEVKMGLGLKSIRHLTELLNGKFQIQTEAGKGFVVSVEFEKGDEG